MPFASAPIVWRARRSASPEPPSHHPAPTPDPDWLEQTGTDLSPKELVYKRVRDELRAYTQDTRPVTPETAATITAEAAWKALEELNLIPREDEDVNTAH